MAYMVQKGSLKLNGKRYEPGDIVPDDAVTIRLTRSGRVLVVPDASVDQLAGGAGMYDPGQRTVAQVLEYVEGHPEKARKVYEAEAAGGKRSTLLGPLQERLAEQEQEKRIGEAGEPRTEVPGDTLPPRAPARTAEEREAALRSEGKALAAADREAALAKAKVAGPRTVGDPSATLTEPPEPGEPAGAATSADLGEATTDEMRKRAGTDGAGQPNPSAPVPAKYDPASYTITDVLVYAEAHPDALLDLGKAERAGKNRQKLLEELGRRLSAQTTPPA